MDRTFKWYMVNVVLSLALVMTFVTIGAHAVTPADRIACNSPYSGTTKYNLSG